MAFQDRLIGLEKKGEIRQGKLPLLDEMIKALINKVAEKDKVGIVIILSVFLNSLKGGSKAERVKKKWEEINDKVKELLKKISNNQTLTLEEVMEIYGEIMEYANSEHNYMFMRRIDLTDEEDILMMDFEEG